MFPLSQYHNTLQHQEQPIHYIQSSQLKTIDPVRWSQSSDIVMRARPRAVLTAEQAIEIYRRRPQTVQSLLIHDQTSGGRTLDVAMHFGVSPKTVRDIWNRRSWAPETRPLWTPGEMPANPRRRPQRRQHVNDGRGGISGGQQNTGFVLVDSVTRSNESYDLATTSSTELSNAGLHYSHLSVASRPGPHQLPRSQDHRRQPIIIHPQHSMFPLNFSIQHPLCPHQPLHLPPPSWASIQTPSESPEPIAQMDRDAMPVCTGLIKEQLPALRSQQAAPTTGANMTSAVASPPPPNTTSLFALHDPPHPRQPHPVPLQPKLETEAGPFPSFSDVASQDARPATDADSVLCEGSEAAPEEAAVAQDPFHSDWPHW
jgi:hypothetical protein